MPTESLERRALRQALEEPNTVALGVQAVHVIEDDRQVAMFPELAIKTKDRQVAFEPAGSAGQGLTDDPAFAQPVAADEDEELKMPACKGLDDRLQLEVGRQAHPRQHGFSGLAHEGTPSNGRASGSQTRRPSVYLAWRTKSRRFPTAAHMPGSTSQQQHHRTRTEPSF